MNESQKDQWRTPPEIVDWAAGIIGGQFDADAACTLANSVAAPLWHRELGFRNQDSLSAPWPDDLIIWCNPPYSKIDPWIDRALECKSLVAMLIMSPNGESRFGRLLPRAHEIAITGYKNAKGREVSGRISFLGADGKPANGNTRGSSLFLINPTYGIGQRSFVRLDEIFLREAA